MVIRPATVDDAAPLSALATRVFRETFGPDNRPADLDHYMASAFGEAIQRAEIADADIITLLLEMDGAPAGYAQLYLVSPHALVPAGAIELRRFYIDRPWHGRGLAPALMQAVEREAAERAAPALWLGVWERNPRAIGFYRKCAYLDVGSQSFLMGTDPQTDRVMVRPLATASARPAAPERLYTSRLALERPRTEDADAIFTRYASDPDVTPYVAFPRHRSVDDARAFIGFSDTEWARWSAGPYLIRSQADGALLGGTGLMFETAFRASTGYVLSRDAWGAGYATEALVAMVDVARAIGLRRLSALVHPEHARSIRVLEKGGFTREALLQRYDEFPNLTPGEPSDVYSYVRLF
jgi:RimJ/RimL family protein N-acetyltransferase